MATIDLATLVGANIAPSVMANKLPLHYADVEIDLDDAATEKGSALAAADVIEAIDVPAGSVIVAAGIEVIEAQTGATALTLDVGVTGSDADAFVDGFDLVAATAGDYAVQPSAYQPIVVGESTDTVDVLIATQTGTNTGGVIRVWVVYADITAKRKPGLAALKS